MALECSLSALAALDRDDLDAVQALLDACTKALLEPSLWYWALGLTVACALVGALLGMTKGRWLWGLLWGLALGPIGWIVVMLSASRQPLCPECAKPNPAGLKRCRHCGTDLALAATRSSRSRLRDASQSRNWK
ncbi:hypothetical protein [Dokdonella sp.]|uniref:hypothetical protein n=1 Tax=Dokdonella sp. TaxID=2291710 RepID=UPI0025B9F157|nr:hypothetical protein [Dokdonella sp.]MBX3688958.1 hypothetical protein [Dokdonella sp.]